MKMNYSPISYLASNNSTGGIDVSPSCNCRALGARPRNAVHARRQGGNRHVCGYKPPVYRRQRQDSRRDYLVAGDCLGVAGGGKTAEETTWWRVTAWEWRAENIHKYLHKGSKVMVVGQLRPDPATGNPRIWTGKDGTPHASYDVTANQVIFLSSRGDDDDTVHGVTPSVQVFTTSNDDIPF